MQNLPLDGDGQFTFQFAQPVVATLVRMSAGNPQQGKGEIFRLEELPVYGYEETDSLSPSDELVDQDTEVLPRPASAVELLSGNGHCSTALVKCRRRSFTGATLDVTACALLRAIRSDSIGVPYSAFFIRLPIVDDYDIH